MKKITQEIVRGDTYKSEVYEYVTPAGDAIDISGYSFLSQVRVSPQDTDPVFEFTVEKVDAANGLFRLTLVPADTENLQLSHIAYGPTLFVYDLQVTEDADPTNVETPMGGTVKVHADVTR